MGEGPSLPEGAGMESPRSILLLCDSTEVSLLQTPATEHSWLCLDLLFCAERVS